MEEVDDLRSMCASTRPMLHSPNVWLADAAK
jgi:hypothetical protein